MKKVNLNNMYESSNPPVDINTLWVDRDETTDKIRAIHKYDTSKGEWVPDMVSVDYMAPENPDEKPVKPEITYPMALFNYYDIEDGYHINVHIYEGRATSGGDVFNVYILDGEGIPDEICNILYPDNIEETSEQYATAYIEGSDGYMFKIQSFIDKSFIPNKTGQNIYSISLKMSLPVEGLAGTTWIVHKGVGKYPYADIQLDDGTIITNIEEVLNIYYDQKDGRGLEYIVIHRSESNNRK